MNNKFLPARTVTLLQSRTLPKLSIENQVRSSSHLDLPAKTLNSGAVLLPKISLVCWRISRGLNVFKKENEIALPFSCIRYPSLSRLEPRALWVAVAADWTEHLLPWMTRLCQLSKRKGRWKSPIRRIFLQRKGGCRAHRRRHSAVLQLLRMSGKKLGVFSLSSTRPSKISQVR